MQYNKPEPPEQIFEAFRGGFDDFVTTDEANREEIRVLKTVSLNGIPIFTLTLADVAKGRWNNEPEGWRVLPVSASGNSPAAGQPALAEVVFAGRDRTPRLVSFSQHAQVAEFFKHFKRILEAQELMAGRGYELRLLRIPGLLVEAFWLRSPDGGNDVVIPIRAPAGLEKWQYYPLDQFFRAAQPLIGKFLALDRETA